MLSNAFKKSFSSVYEPTAYKKLYKLMLGFFIKDHELIDNDFELQFTANLDKSGFVVDIN